LRIPTSKGKKPFVSVSDPDTEPHGPSKDLHRRMNKVDPDPAAGTFGQRAKSQGSFKKKSKQK
jgi:hypothetical protein